METGLERRRERGREIVDEEESKKKREGWMEKKEE